MSGHNAAVFLDRDGTINEEVNFITSPDQLVLIPRAGQAVRALNELGLLTVVISNQSGIARGFLTENDLGPIHDRLRSELSRAGARLDLIKYCPHHPTEGSAPYRMDCRCRKPNPGMLEDAAAELDIDLSNSFVVGDRLADVMAGVNAGCRSILVLTGYGRMAIEELKKDGSIKPEYIADDLSAAVEYISHTITHVSHHP